MKPRYREKVTVVYKDTDSLLYRIETEYLYSDMESIKNFLVLSIILGIINSSNQQEEAANNEGRIEWSNSTGKYLRSKLYSIEFDSGVKQSAKGVQKCVKKP